MQYLRTGLLCLALVANAAEVTPVQKVIQLMDGMLEKGRQDKRAEQVQFAAYKQFCDETENEKAMAIQTAKEDIDVYNANIEKLTSDIDELSERIETTEHHLANMKGDMKSATFVRKVDKQQYERDLKDYTESITAVKQVQGNVSAGSQNIAQASFAQLSNANKMTNAQRDAIVASIRRSAGLQPTQDAYEVKSDDALGGMLEEMNEKFNGQRNEVQKKEDESIHNYELLMQESEMAAKEAEDELTAANEERARKTDERAQNEGDLADTTNRMNEDTKIRKDTAAACAQKKKEFEQRQELRAEELVAVDKAREIIASNAVSNNADKHLPSMVQLKKGHALVQVSTTQEELHQAQVAEYLQYRGKQLNSDVLAALADRVAQDPFVKIRKMIEDMIMKLLEQANQEATQKGYCDTELKTNEKTRTEKAELVDSLKAQIDELTASIAKGKEKIAELAGELDQINAAIMEQTELREQEKEKNDKTVADAQEASTAVAEALEVLRTFYEKAGKATVLIQKQPEAPEVFDEPYRGMGGESGGVVGMLEVIASDFTRLEAETKTAEIEAQKEYDQFMSDSNEDKAAKTKSQEHSVKKKSREEEYLERSKVDLEQAQDELAAANNYYDKLKPTCVDTGLSYAERVKRREEEIASLQEALKILQGEAIA